MLGKIFGRRPAEAPPPPAMPRHPGPDADGVARAIPADLWDGPNGDFLRKLGMSPDDASNLMPTQQSVQAKADAVKSAQDRKTAEVNAALPAGVAVIPWALIPWSIWSRDHADYLMITCEFYPAGLWNTMLLPADAASAQALGLPAHLRGIPDGLEDASNRLIGDIRARDAKALQAAGAAVMGGGLEGLDAFAAAKRQAAGNIVGLAHYLGAAVYGAPAWARHGELLAGKLGWTAGRG
jgi:hypothetical protein